MYGTLTSYIHGVYTCGSNLWVAASPSLYMAVPAVAYGIKGRSSSRRCVVLCAAAPVAIGVRGFLFL